MFHRSRISPRGLLLAALVILPAGCGTPLPDPFTSAKAVTLTGNPLTDFAPVTAQFARYAATDVAAALADAQAQTPPDAVGISCWSTLQEVLPLLQTPTGAVGAAAIQKGRDLQRAVPLVVNACNGLIPVLTAL
jgi:hypothetical protein